MSHAVDLIFAKDIDALGKLAAKDFKPDHNKNTPLRVACLFGLKEAVKICLKNEPKIDARNKDGDTALMGAAMHGFDEIVEMLIAHGCNIDLQNKMKHYAFSLAVRNDHVSTVKILLAYAAKTNKWVGYSSPFEMCVPDKKPEMVDLMLEFATTSEQVKKLMWQIRSYSKYPEFEKLNERLQERLEDAQKFGQ